MAELIPSLLIANRGEIACRIIRTARRLGIRTIAVYSEADAQALHVCEADEAWPIGPAAALESYLNSERILEAAGRSRAAAIHPGYGFLSENAAFAEACTGQGIIFIGPPAAAIRAMGSKSAAKRLMEQAGVPLVPGYHGVDQADATLAAAAERIGFPVLIKPSEGGGGKGMKIVWRRDEFPAALASARREAGASFADETVLIERYLERPRHIEVQVFADTKGNFLHLFERDCSIQRRHQKVIEEAPAPGLAQPLRQQICAAALDAARAVGYVGAGTVEFIFEAGRFYFMEMNTRLQVEHPVTEAITGVDLVEWQIRVASGQALPLRQEQIAIAGHAVEARLYAEDPARDFLPQSGRLLHLSWPRQEGIRIDAGLRAGDAVGIHYDPLLAKVIAHGPDRATALRRLEAALAETEIVGLATNRAFLRAIAGHPALAAGEIDTGFIARHLADLTCAPATGDRELVLAALAILLEERRRAAAQARSGSDPHSPWALAGPFRLLGTARVRLTLATEVAPVMVVAEAADDGFLITLPGGSSVARGTLAPDGRLAAEVDGRRLVARIHRRNTDSGEEITLFIEGAAHAIGLLDPLRRGSRLAADSGRLVAPMPGRVVQLAISAGDRVSKGSLLVVVEAMKMEHAMRAPGDGVVERVDCRVGDLVEEGAVLLVLSSDTEDAA